MNQVGPLIENMLRSYNLWHNYRQYLIVQSWEEIVGSKLASVTRAENMHRGLLKIRVKDSVWSYHLAMLKPQIIEKLNKYAGSRIVKDIAFYLDDSPDE